MGCLNGVFLPLSKVLFVVSGPDTSLCAKKPKGSCKVKPPGGTKKYVNMKDIYFAEIQIQTLLLSVWHYSVMETHSSRVEALKLLRLQLNARLQYIFHLVC